MQRAGHASKFTLRAAATMLVATCALACSEHSPGPDASAGDHAAASGTASGNGGTGGGDHTGASGTASGDPAASGATGAGAGGRGASGASGSASTGAGAGDAAVAMDAAMSDAQAGGGAGSPGGNPTAASVWSKLSVMVVVNPKDHGAVGDGAADDLRALADTVDALPAAGGIVYLPPMATFKKTNLLVITKSHVKLWAPNRQAEVFQSVAGQRRHQSIICRNNQGCGFFGLKLRSDASARFDALEDNQISADHGSLVEVVGCEIAGSAATGLMLFGSTEQYIEGNYIHHTWADHIHHTEAARQSWVWNNYVFNEDPSRGDDGVACVTYGPSSPRCGDMEWWRNTILHTGWGRGYSVIGGDQIQIHDNWAIGVAGAGIIVASEPSYDTSNSEDISIERNNVYQCAQSVGHPGILISGLNTTSGPLRNIALRDNVSVDNPNGPYRAEGAYENVTNQGMMTQSSALPKPIPTQADIRIADTTVLRTRDLSHVGAQFRRGLYRIHVRRAPEPRADGFEQRFEYVLSGPADRLSAFASARVAEGAYVSEQRSVGASAYALLLSAAPLEVPSELSDVAFRALRAGDRDATLSWLWQRLDTGNY